MIAVRIKTGICIDCSDGKEKPLIAKRCRTHYWQHRKAVKNPKTVWKEEKRKELKKFLNPIPKVSAKRKVENRKYTIERLRFLAQPENLRCPITNERTTDIHHKKGRIESLLLDTRYWLAVSRNGHREIEENPDWAKEQGYSLSRLEK